MRSATCSDMLLKAAATLPISSCRRKLSFCRNSPSVMAAAAAASRRMGRLMPVAIKRPMATASANAATAPQKMSPCRFERAVAKARRGSETLSTLTGRLCLSVSVRARLAYLPSMKVDCPCASGLKVADTVSSAGSVLAVEIPLV